MSKIAGRLRLEDGTHFVDARGPLLPLFYHYGEGLGVYKRNRAWCERQLDAIAAHGHGVRTWLTIGWYEYWRGREVAPVSFDGRDGAAVAAWDDYDDQLRGYLAALGARGLKLYASFGDLQMFNDDDARTIRFLRHAGRVCREAGDVVVMADVNEAWQNVLHDGRPAPSHVARLVRAFADQARLPLWGVSAPPESSEDVDDINRWSSPQLFVVHSLRVEEKPARDELSDDARLIERLFQTTYGVAGRRPPARLVGWQAEPTGPGEYVSIGRMNNPETLALLGVTSWLSRQAWTYMSSVGVKDDGQVPIESQPGFREVSLLHGLLPMDLMRWPLHVHGAHHDAVVTSAGAFADESNGFARVDQRIDPRSGRVVAVAYGGGGKRAIQVRRPFKDARIIHPIRGQVWAGAGDGQRPLPFDDDGAVGWVVLVQY